VLCCSGKWQHRQRTTGYLLGSTCPRLPGYKFAWPTCAAVGFRHFCSGFQTSVVFRHFFSLGFKFDLILIGLGLSLMKYWSHSHVYISDLVVSNWLCSLSAMTSECSILLIRISGHCEYFSSEEIMIITFIYYFRYVIDNVYCFVLRFVFRFNMYLNWLHCSRSWFCIFWSRSAYTSIL